jgi:hypothetical protein
MVIQHVDFMQDFDPMAEHRPSRVGDRDDEYKARRRNQIISPERHDPFAGKHSPGILHTNTLD